VTLLYPTRPGAFCPIKQVIAAREPNATAIRLLIDPTTWLDLDENEFPFLDLDIPTEVIP
jgi:hypothetical protein